MVNVVRACVLLLIMAAALCAHVAICDEKSAERTEEQMLSDYVDWFHRNMNSKYADKAKTLIPPLIKYAHKHDVDSFLLAQTFSSESSWRNFNGALGERGPGHVMPGSWSKQFDLNTLDGQIEASAYLWRVALDKCRVSDTEKHLYRAFTNYASGHCVSKSATTQRKMSARLRQYNAAVKMFRGNNV